MTLLSALASAIERCSRYISEVASLVADAEYSTSSHDPFFTQADAEYDHGYVVVVPAITLAHSSYPVVGSTITILSSAHRLLPADRISLAHKVWSPKQIFSDDFELWTGWNNYGLGTVSWSTAVAHGGVASLKKDGNNDPNGGYKLLGQTIGLDVELEGWIYRPSPWSGGGADRLAIEDSSFNGYGFQISHDNNYAYIERRDSGSPTTLGSSVSFNPPENAWYKFLFQMLCGGKFNLYIYDQNLNLLASITNVSDTTYNQFDRVVVHGGYEYYVDDLIVRA